MHVSGHSDSDSPKNLTVAHLIPAKFKNQDYISRELMSQTSWNVLLRALSKNDFPKEELDQNRIKIKWLDSITMSDISDVRGAGEKTIRQLLNDFEALEDDLRIEQNPRATTRLIDFLPEKFLTQQYIFQNQLTKPSWNILVRLLMKRKNIAGYEGTEVIFVNSLSEITVEDLKDTKHVGIVRFEKLCSELGWLEVPIEKSPATAYRLLNPDGVLFKKNEKIPEIPMPLDLQMIRTVVSDSNWKDRLKEQFAIEDVEYIKTRYRNLYIFLNRFSGRTLEEIGRDVAITRERVRQILEQDFTELQNYGYYLGKSLQELLENRLTEFKLGNSATEKLYFDEIEKIVRLQLMDSPGLTYPEISEITGKGTDWLIENISNQSKKFISTLDVEQDKNFREFKKEEIIKALKDAARLNSPLTQTIYGDLVQSGRVIGPGPQTAAKRFGTWAKACEAAGITFQRSIRSSYETKWEDEEIVKAIIRFLQNQNFGRSIEQYDKWRSTVDVYAPSGARVRLSFGTWNRARSAAFKYMRQHGIRPNLT